MKVTPYQLNAAMLQESRRVVEQQHLAELNRLNCQEKQQVKQQEFHKQWVSAAHVDVLV